MIQTPEERRAFLHARRERQERVNAILLKALRGAFRNATIDQNRLDAFTVRLDEAGVDMDEIEEIIGRGNPDLIDAD